MLYNQEAEKNVLGAIIQDNDSICKVIDILEPKDFYHIENQVIYATCKRMYEESKAIDITTLTVELGTKLKEVGGITYISKISDILNAKHIKSHAQIVKDKSILRQLRKNLNEAQNKIESEEDPQQVIKFIQDNTMTITNTKDETGDISSAIEGFLQDLEFRCKNGGAVQGIETHINGLDSILGGLHRQELIIVGARPSMGKSVFASNLGLNISLVSKKKVAIFSLEMNNVSIVKRMVCKLCMIDGYDIRDGKLNDKQWIDISQATNTLNTDKLKLFEKTMSLNKILAECKKLKIQGGLDVVIIDYLQLIQGLSKENRNQEISDISRKLKLLAKELDITIIALSQLSRKMDERSDRRPMLSDLRESGSIEQDADVVLFLYRDEYYNEDTEDKGILEILVAKQRDGEIGRVKAAWKPEYQLISNIDYVHEGTFREDAFKGGK